MKFQPIGVFTNKFFTTPTSARTKRHNATKGADITEQTKRQRDRETEGQRDGRAE